MNRLQVRRIYKSIREYDCGISQVPEVKQETLIKKEEDINEIECIYQRKIEENSSQKSTNTGESCNINVCSNKDLKNKCVKIEFEPELEKNEHQKQTEELKNDTTKVEDDEEFANFYENLITYYSKESVLNQSKIFDEINEPSIELKKKPLTAGQKHYWKNKERILASSKNWRERNKETLQATNQRKRSENRQQTRDKVNLRYANNKERERQKQREYRSKNRDKINKNIREKRLRN